MPEKCHVHNCSQPVTAKGLCQKHYMRVKRHGDVGETRPDDWGNRRKHPAYKAWCNLCRYHRQDMQDSWASNFWNFAKDVPEKPANSRAQRSDPTEPWGVNNFYWKETRSASQDRKQYMKEWHKHARAANPEYYADRYLKKRYGVTFEWYSKKLSEQNNVCAICKQSEKSVIKGKVISMSVDHCHKTGNARGLICTKCNRGLGLFCDDVSVLESAIKYLKS